MRSLYGGAGLCVLLLGCGGSTNSPPAQDGGPGAGGSSGGGAGGSAGSTGSGGSAGAACTPACGEGRNCCGNSCTNLQNDPRNCGQCGRACNQNTLCTGGECITPPCEATCEAGASCCGTECCARGQLCCDPQGPVEIGPRCTPPDERGTCPMGCAPLCKCASPDTPIATDFGQTAIASLRVGDLVYSVDQGAIKLVPILRTQRIPANNHRVVRLRLVTGAVLEISALHPTADGRSFGELVEGGFLDGVRIKDVETVPYEHAATYDILPDSDTGTYFAAGVLLASTLTEWDGFSRPARFTSPACTSSVWAARRGSSVGRQ